MNPFCPDTNRLAGWLDGTLPEQERAGVTSHLAKCDDCRRAAALARVALESVPETPIDARSEERWLAAVARRPALSWRARIAVLVAAGLLIALTVFIISRPSPSSQPPPGARTEPEKKDFVKVEPKTEDPKKEEKKDEVVKEEPKKEEPKKEEKKEEVVKEEPKKEDKKEEPVVKEEPKKEEEKKPSVTRPDRSGAYAAISLLDGSGDLWFKPGEKEEFAKAQSRFNAGFAQSLKSGKSPASFTINGRATVALEPETVVWVASVKKSSAYAIEFEKGSAIIDSEGASQHWEISYGESTLVLPVVSGRLMVEAKDSKLQTHVLLGRIQVKLSNQLVDVDEGKFVEGEDVRKGDASLYKKKMALLKEIRPKFRTIFSANFDSNDPFAFTVAAGRLSKTEGFLSADLPGSATMSKGGMTAEIIGGLRFGTEITYLSGLTLRFKYRGNTDVIEFRAGKHAGRCTVKDTKGQWLTAEVPLSIFEDEGVPLVSGDLFDELFFLIPKKDKSSNRGGILDIDGLELIRSAQFTH